jgi:hypothetical protein
MVVLKVSSPGVGREAVELEVRAVGDGDVVAAVGLEAERA